MIIIYYYYYYYCYDHFPPWNITTESRRSHFPDKIDNRVNLRVWNDDEHYRQKACKYCTSDQEVKDETTPLEVAQYNF